MLGKITAGEGDDLPVSAFPMDGTFPTATAQYEKRNLALDIPVWDEKICIQCLKCVAVCPHATIRAKVYESAALKGVPATFKSVDSRIPDFKGMKFILQVAAEDCTGCALCVDVCPAKNKTEAKLKAINMRPQAPLRDAERANWNFFLELPELDRRKVKTTQLRQQQLLRPLFEFSGACAGCGETPYIKMVSQLFGDRAVIANATGCSSIYGGNLPTTPYCVDKAGRGPTWCNSLFEDNAEFGLGFRVSIDKQKEFATELVKKLAPQLGDDLVTGIVNAVQTDEAGIYEQRERVVALKQKLAKVDSIEAKTCCPSPTRWSNAASGFSAGMAGPTTSATAAWTTCWPAAAMSTCSSWTRKFIPTPAGKCPNPLRGARWRNSPPAANQPARKTSA